MFSKIDCRQSAGSAEFKRVVAGLFINRNATRWGKNQSIGIRICIGNRWNRSPVTVTMFCPDPVASSRFDKFA